MKKFGELKKGDYIYYWDHGKLHSQLILDIEEKEDTETGIIWYSSKGRWSDKYVLLITKHKTYKLYEYTLSCSSDTYGGMKRFASIEAANAYLCERTLHINKKIAKLSKDLDKYKRLQSYYTEATCELLKT